MPLAGHGGRRFAFPPYGFRCMKNVISGKPAGASLVYLNYTQAELDAAYDQSAYQPNIQQLRDRWISNSERTRQRIGPPLRRPYGPAEIEQLDIFRTERGTDRAGA